MKIGFDNEKYLQLQAEHITARRAQFGGKLYLEFGGKLFDDYHASRVLPGFQPDSKIRMLQTLKDDVEIVVAICAGDIEKNKMRGDLGISYDVDVLRLIDVFRGLGFYVGSVVITQYAGQPAADAFIKRLSALGVKSYKHYPIAGYPSDVAHIVSDEGLGKNEYIETTRPLIVVTAPGPGSGKMATCLSQLYHDNRRGIRAGYAKYETFPIWNLPLKHPVNLAYEAATADLNDVNMIDPFHLEAYGKTTVNYNRDVEIFPVLAAMFRMIQGECPYKSPTDMGVNMAGFAIVDDEACQEASRMEILRRYIQEKRREGVRIPYMTLILAAYFKAYQENPKINRFIMNSKIYQRNHFCVSFVILKTRADGRADETSIKVFFEDGDDIFSINRKIEEAVAQNQVAAHNNNTDKFANFLFAIPILPGLLFGLVKLMDRCGVLPRKIIDLSPFHTSLFITNLASINTNSIFHHCYEFGTTGVFVSMGKPIANYRSGEYNKKMIPLSVVMDERICTGHEYALFWASVRRYLKHPELLEGKPTEENADLAEECV